MRKIILIITITALMTGFFAFSAMAYGMGPGMRPMGHFRNDLDLTFDQQQKILAIRQDFQKDTLSLRFDLQEKNLELRQLWEANPLNQTAIEAKTKEVTDLRVQMTTKAQAMHEKIKSVLTAEQLKKLNDNNRQNYGPGPGRRGGHRGCIF
jgi:Spy/CpxP family protein refolding chaperone